MLTLRAAKLCPETQAEGVTSPKTRRQKDRRWRGRRQTGRGRVGKGWIGDGPVEEVDAEEMDGSEEREIMVTGGKESVIQ